MKHLISLMTPTFCQGACTLILISLTSPSAMGGSITIQAKKEVQEQAPADGGLENAKGHSRPSQSENLEMKMPQFFSRSAKALAGGLTVVKSPAGLGSKDTSKIPEDPVSLKNMKHQREALNESVKKGTFLSEQQREIMKRLK